MAKGAKASEAMRYGARIGGWGLKGTWKSVISDFRDDWSPKLIARVVPHVLTFTLERPFPADLDALYVGLDLPDHKLPKRQ